MPFCSNYTYTNINTQFPIYLRGEKKERKKITFHNIATDNYLSITKEPSGAPHSCTSHLSWNIEKVIGTESSYTGIYILERGNRKWDRNSVNKYGACWSRAFYYT